jgi:hypothetical protein
MCKWKCVAMEKKNNNNQFSLSINQLLAYYCTSGYLDARNKKYSNNRTAMQWSYIPYIGKFLSLKFFINDLF